MGPANAGVHMGKVLIQIADTEGPLLRSGPPPAELPAAEEPDVAPAAEADPPVKAVFTCRRDRSYVITGGLGGFGLALAHWLAAKGASHLVLTSKRCGSDAIDSMVCIRSSCTSGQYASHAGCADLQAVRHLLYDRPGWLGCGPADQAV